MIFSPYFWLIAAALLLGSYGGGRLQQRVYDAAAFQKKLDSIELETAKRMLKAQEATTIVVTEYVKGAEKIRTVFKDRVQIITKEIPHEVIVKSDADCAVPVYFVGLWNSANQGSIPNTSQGVDGSRSPVKLSEIGAQHDREAELCLIKEKKLEKLQDWVKQQCRTLNLVECAHGG